MSNTATLVGNLTDNPELRYTKDGSPVASLSLAVSRRVRRDGQWADQLDGYFDVTCFGKLAEHAADSLHKGARAMATGRLEQSSYDDRNGVRRTAVKLIADEVAPALRFATAEVHKAAKAVADGDGQAGD